jgi:hypothetical protein
MSWQVTAPSRRRGNCSRGVFRPVTSRRLHEPREPKSRNRQSGRNVPARQKTRQRKDKLCMAPEKQFRLAQRFSWAAASYSVDHGKPSLRGANLVSRCAVGGVGTPLTTLKFPGFSVGLGRDGITSGAASELAQTHEGSHHDWEHRSGPDRGVGHDREVGRSTQLGSRREIRRDSKIAYSGHTAGCWGSGLVISFHLSGASRGGRCRQLLYEN